MKQFALMGAAGYIAPRHMRAIKDTGNELAAAVNPSDAVSRVINFCPDYHLLTKSDNFITRCRTVA